jgi:hypothetical protein
MNMSSAWIAANRERIPAMKRAGYIGNDGYAMQNLMESFAAFKPLTPELHRIKVPTLIMNGEFDFFTPRECHEVIRKHVANSRLVIIPRAYHAFTLEMPAITMRQIEVFLEQIAAGTWHGDQSVWIASDDPAAAEQWLPCAGDWMRAVQPADSAASVAAPARPVAARAGKAHQAPRERQAKQPGDQGAKAMTRPSTKKATVARAAKAIPATPAKAATKATPRRKTA